MDTSTPKERRQARTRQAILDTAMEIISEKGADKLSLREIARRIDYSPSGLYEYFDGKDDIIAAVCEEGNDRLREALSAIDETLPLSQYLIELGMAYIRFAHNHPQHFLFQFMQRDALKDDDMLNDNELDPNDSFAILYNAVQSGIESGKIRPGEGMDAMEIAYGIWALPHGAAMLQVHYLNGLSINFERADRFAMETYIRALVNDSASSA